MEGPFIPVERGVAWGLRKRAVDERCADGPGIAAHCGTCFGFD